MNDGYGLGADWQTGGGPGQGRKAPASDANLHQFDVKLKNKILHTK